MRGVLPISVSLLAILSCNSGDGGPTEPEEFSGDYEIASINGQGLPFVDIVAPLILDSLMIVRGDLHVLSRGRLRLVFHRQWYRRNASRDPVYTDTLVRSYLIEDDMVIVEHATGGLQGPYTDTMMVTGNTANYHQFINRYNAGHFWRDVLFVRTAP